MNDCPNAEIRDRLPDLLHERLAPGTRAEVVAHVERCADCRAELALLKDMRRVLAAPRVDVAGIVRALPRPGETRRSMVPLRSRRFDWRVAASIAALVVGGVSIGTYATIGRNVHEAAVGEQLGAQTAAVQPLDSVARQHAVLGAAVASSAAGTSTAAAAGGSTAPAAAKGAVTELATGDGLSDMSAGQLQALLADIDHMQPIPPAEPDTLAGPGAVNMEEN